MKLGKKWMCRVVALVSALMMPICSSGCEISIEGLEGALSGLTGNVGSESGEENKGEKTKQEKKKEQALANLQYTLNEDGESYSVGIFKNEEEAYAVLDNFNNLTPKAVEKLDFPTTFEIPSEYNGKPVTKINDYGFHGCSFFEVIIPDTVKEIGAMAFVFAGRMTIGKSVEKIDEDFIQVAAEVYNLSSVKILERQMYPSILYVHTTADTPSKLKTTEDGYVFVEKDTDIGLEQAYCVGYVGEETALTLPKDYKGGSYNCSIGLLLNFDIISVVIPEGLRYIALDNLRFCCCYNLKSVTIPATVTGIEWKSFECCPNLNSIILVDPTGWKYWNVDSSPSWTPVKEDLSDPAKAADFIINQENSLRKY